MRTVKTTIPTEKKFNWALPGQKISHEALMASIQEAEKGPFLTLEEAIQDFETWLKLREKK